MKIINIIENLDKGAVENWLVRIFLENRKLRPDWEWTFYCILGREGRLDEIVKEAGGEIIYSPVSISNKVAFLKHLRRTLKNGRFDIIHSHHDYLSGFYLLASRGIHFKKRLLHIHNTDKALPVGNRLLHRLLLYPLKQLALYYTDIVIGISNDTLKEFVGAGQTSNRRCKILYYGIDLYLFEQGVDDAFLKKELNIPDESKLLLFVGRMNALKNPIFIVEILKEVLEKRNDVYAVFVGKGDCEKDVQEKAEALGITTHIRMLGWRNDIAAIMKSSDIFIFPRVEYPKEGLGLVVIESQAAGLPMILSYGIVEDAVVVKDLAHFIALSDNPKDWAAKVLNIINNAPVISKEVALELVYQSRFELKKATENFLALYDN